MDTSKIAVEPRLDRTVDGGRIHGVDQQHRSVAPAEEPSRLGGLYEGRYTGWSTKCSPSEREKLGQLDQAEGGSARSLLREIPSEDDVPVISDSTVKR